MKNLQSIIFFIAQFGFFYAYPQGHHVKFEHISLIDGLSQGNIQCILQDSRGFMWFGSGDGLNKYDGYTITTFKYNEQNPNSISNSFIKSLAEDKNGNLWIATLGGGVCLYDRNKELFTQLKHNPNNTNSISTNITNSILVDKQGMIWIGTIGGLDMYDPVKKTFLHYKHLPLESNSLSDSHVRQVFEDKQGNIWACTLSGGLNLLNKKSGTFTSFKNNKNDIKSIGGNNVYTMFEDSKNRIWVGLIDKGLDLFDRASGTFTHFTHSDNNPNSLSANIVFSINEDAESNLWIGTENGGLTIFNYNEGTFKTFKNDEVDKESISNNSTYAIYRDTKNNMWLGNFAEGVDLVNTDNNNFAHYKHMLQTNSLSNNHVLSIFEDSKKNIWIGTDGGGLNLFDPTNGNFTHYLHQQNNAQSICGNYVTISCEDSEGNIWVGTWGDGLTIFNTASNTFKHFKNEIGNAGSLSNNNVWKIFKDKENNMWVGTYGGGLNLLNADKNSFTRYNYSYSKSGAISSDNVLNIFEDSDGLLWICTQNAGINSFDKKTKLFTTYLHSDKKNSISDNNATTVLEGSDKNIWITTRMGLNMFNKKTNHFTVYTKANGLPDNSIASILEDNNKNFWMGTNTGIACFNLLTKKIKNYTKSDGLQAREFKQHASCKSAAGIMYFGGNNGFNQFAPEKIKKIIFDPSLVITNFQIFNKEVPIVSENNSSSPLKKSITETKTITLPYNSSVFSFEFASLNYTPDNKKKYLYKLEGFDKDWNEAGKARMATYTNLNPGTYVFKVKGLNNEGNWSLNIVSIEIIIKPPFWLTWWFKTFMLILFIAGIFGIDQYRNKLITSQKIKLQQQVAKQTEQLLLLAQEEHIARTAAEKAIVNTKLANKELKIKNRELEQFAYVASHDLQEPLRTTSGFVDLLQKQYKGKLDDKADKYLNFIADASYRMRVLIKDLLEFSRIGNKAEFTIVDCNIILNNLLSDIAAAIQDSNASIKFEQMPILMGYPTEIKLLFQNLIVNAIKFRKKNIAPIISISAEKKESFWEFAVSDNGIGIEKEHNERIFDIFQRLHTRTEYEGSGIGLSHCKKIVELHNGKIWVSSTPGLGSTFYFTIPITFEPKLLR